jgi:hypothetical protein
MKGKAFTVQDIETLKRLSKGAKLAAATLAEVGKAIDTLKLMYRQTRASGRMEGDRRITNDINLIDFD